MPLECTPTAAYWFKASPAWRMTHEYHCINEGAKMISAGVISAVQDFVACVLPMALFWDLRISRQAKFALGFVFSLGLITCTCGVIRTRFIYRVFFQTYDVTWAVRPALALTIMESCLGITCASMPALKSGLQRCFHVVIDPFTYGSSKSLSRRWKNPFFNSYQQSIQDYFDRSGGGGGGGSRRRGGGYTPGLKVPPNTSAGECRRLLCGRQAGKQASRLTVVCERRFRAFAVAQAVVDVEERGRDRAVDGAQRENTGRRGVTGRGKFRKREPSSVAWGAPLLCWSACFTQLTEAKHFLVV
ncbi:hypothetical protein BK809_0002822 [Diplodia seriata]|uniref:Rhodopsin domain-containing protein n=1 Tax=Diplodia seriata TaxID=420778 RepID=A0A1S8BKV1_9PEZI|nr:hypothetical protein BK809_0002822 [Diplodia seriata]